MAQLIDLFNQYGIYFFLGLLVLDLAILIFVFMLRKNFRKIFGGSPTSGVDLERVLLELRENQSFSTKATEELSNRIISLESAIILLLNSSVALVENDWFSLSSKSTRSKSTPLVGEPPKIFLKFFRNIKTKIKMAKSKTKSPRKK